MKKQLFQNKLIVKKSRTHGYGVFAGKPLKKGELIEECYLLLCKKMYKCLEDYFFEAKNKKYALLLGFGGIYNHSEDPNADYTISNTKKLATIKANRTIKKGEEIFVTYGEDWFKTRDIKPK